MCNASDKAVGAVLGQRVGKVPHVIYYVSRVLDPAQCNYTSIEKEMHAVVIGPESFVLICWVLKLLFILIILLLNNC